MADTVSPLDPETPVSLALSGGTIELMSIRGAQVQPASAVLRRLQPIFPDLWALISGGDADTDGPGGNSWEAALDRGLEIGAEHGADIIALVAAVTGRDAAWVGGLSLSDLWRLFFKVVEVNTDFFSRRLLPELAPWIAAVKGAGPTTSSGSSTMAMPDGAATA